MVQGLRICLTTQGNVGRIPGWLTKIPQASQQLNDHTTITEPTIWSLYATMRVCVPPGKILRDATQIPSAKTKTWHRQINKQFFFTKKKKEDTTADKSCQQKVLNLESRCEQLARQRMFTECPRPRRAEDRSSQACSYSITPEKLRYRCQRSGSSYGAEHPGWVGGQSRRTGPHVISKSICWKQQPRTSLGVQWLRIHLPR